MTQPAHLTSRQPHRSRQSDAILERLSALHPKLIDLSLGRIERLLDRLGHPEARLPPVIHVAGTNGKGSLIAYLRAMLEAAGLKVHVYTSPHLVRFHERVRLAGDLIEEAELVALLEECEQANGGEPITFFEITTAAAFLAFTRHPADVVLLETGLGGRLDATNLVARPLLTVITPVSIDHTQFLGESLAEIAGEKAGILKPGVPAVIGRQEPEAMAVFEARAAELGAPLWRAGAEWSGAPEEDGFTWRADGPAYRYPRPCLPGAFQRDNGALAVAVAACLARQDGGRWQIAPEAIRRGLAEARWPGRLQRLTEGPLVESLPDGWELWLDGGHNAAAGEALAESLKGWADRPLHIVFGMMNSKAVGDFLRPVGARAASLHALAIPGEPNGLSPEALVAEAAAVGLDATTTPGAAEAVAEITNGAQEPARILICGSLYLAGRVLAENG
ncbi:MAG: folylpolyglutamate synthase/dihydrofolate synthase family protein [Pseudomonadota bacterium]